MEEEQSVESTLESVKKLITSPSKSSNSDQDVLELTEDDLFDELDEDYQDDGAIPKISKKNFSINQFLTSIDNTNRLGSYSQKKTNNESDLEGKVVSEAVAAQSAANIRNIIKKMELPIENSSLSSSSSNLERAIMNSLKPYLEEWLEQKVTHIIKRELKDIISKQNRKDE